MPKLSPVLLLACTIPVFAQQAPDAGAAQQREALSKLAWMAGRWEGTSTSLVREGPVKASSQEWMKMAAGGTTLVILGLHQRLNADGSKGEVTHDAAGMITWDPAKQKYRFTAHVAQGRHGDFEGEMQGDAFVWRIPIPQGQIRYTIQRNAQGQYTERGVVCRDGQAECAPEIFHMVLDRKGDAQ